MEKQDFPESDVKKPIFETPTAEMAIGDSIAQKIREGVLVNEQKRLEAQEAKEREEKSLVENALDFAAK